MAIITLNGTNVSEANVYLPRMGVWHADLLVDRQDLQLAQCLVNFEDSGIVMNGVALRQGVFAEYLRVRVIGGTGGMYKSVTVAKSYRNVPVSAIASDICAAAGETLNLQSDSTTMNSVVPYWVQIQQGCMAALRSLLQSFGSPIIRMKPDGSIWFGFDTFPVVDGQFEFMLLNQKSHLGQVQIYEEPFVLVPGVNFLGWNVGKVHRRVEKDDVRTIFYAE